MEQVNNTVALTLMDAMATCIGTGSFKLILSLGGEAIFFPACLAAFLPPANLPADLPDLDAAEGTLIETRFEGFSSCVGERGRFFPLMDLPPMDVSLLAAVGSTGCLTMLPPRSRDLIFDEKSFL
jgi:hypothetical protein